MRDLEQRVLREIKNNPDRSRCQIAMALNAPLGSVEQVIRDLEECGEIETTGPLSEM